MLASDEFEGRAPGSVGEARTVTYLTDQFQQLGLTPGNPDGTFVQAVPLVGITPQASGGLDIVRGDEMLTLTPGADYVAYTKRVVEEVSLDGELVFVGYGAVAPEYAWDDFKEVDVTGKVLLMLVNDPPGPDIFGGRAMTYYGRWTYKFEIAAARGAAGALVIHETESAGYPWEVIGSSPYGEQFDLVTEDRNLGRARVEGWIQRAATARLFAMAGFDFEEARRAATQQDFKPIALGLTARTTIINTLRRVDSQNVVARLKGTEAPDETIVYVAHWDHLGRDESLFGDQIFNGAKDNASGTAGLLEIAAAFTRTSSPGRSILFLAVTAEEQGLLGSRYYTGQPLYPLAQTVAAINMDVLNVLGRTRDVTVVGMGQSSLDELAERIATRRGRTLRPDPEPEKGFYYRSDHFEFAKVGIPAFNPDGGVEFLSKDKKEDWGLDMRERYTAEDYHKVSDEVKEYWNLAGAVDDLELFYEMGRELANGEEWPEWSESSEFRTVREADRAAVR
ncbi:MAG: peptidase M28 [Acidobacteria bacterium]|nr:peptidase M28 [Acidobacteriota bacterium]MBF86161.1 peptidase M28 [Acidobacteriota bacterium]